MGQIDLDFKPSVPVFDANVALGRRHDRRVTSESAAQALAEMARFGIDRALVYPAHGVAFDPRDGNDYLVEMLSGTTGLVPQFVANPTADDLDRFVAEAGEHGVKSVRMLPGAGGYPFKDWTVGEWLEWLASEGMPLWLPASDFDPSEVHDTLRGHSQVNVVLSDVHYMHVPWVMPMVRSLPNVHIEVSRFVIPDGITKLIDTVGPERVLFGSRFPDSPMAAQLYSVERSGMDQATLKAVCAGNLERLLYQG